MHLAGANDIQGFFAIAGQESLKTPRLKNTPQGLAELQIVVRNQQCWRLWKHDLDTSTGSPKRGYVQFRYRPGGWRSWPPSNPL